MAARTIGDSSAQVINDSNSGQNGFVQWWNDSGPGAFWNSLTGASNTAAQNSAAASLQEDAQKFNASEAEKQREWEAMMSNTAYQRSVADLKAAGLNPWLAVNNGSSVGSAASASSGIAGAQVSNVNGLAAVGTAAAGIGILLKAIKAFSK